MQKSRKEPMMMVVDTNLKDGGFMQVRIKNSKIDEIFYQGSVEYKTLSRNEVDDVKAWLKDILKSDVQKFREILCNIKDDKVFLDYGKKILLIERDRKRYDEELYKSFYQKAIKDKNLKIVSYDSKKLID